MPSQEEYSCVRCGISPYTIQERTMKYRTYKMSHPVLIGGQVAICDKCGHVMRIPSVSEHNRFLAETAYSSGQVYTAPLKSSEADKTSDTAETSETDDKLLDEEITVEDIERMSGPVDTVTEAPKDQYKTEDAAETEKEEITESVKTTSIETEVAVMVAKRKRGRPRKIALAAENDFDAAISDEDYGTAAGEVSSENEYMQMSLF